MFTAAREPASAAKRCLALPVNRVEQGVVTCSYEGFAAAVDRGVRSSDQRTGWSNAGPTTVGVFPSS
jgi:hypothetical protein